MLDTQIIDEKRCPIIRCDLCMEPITEAGDAIAVFDEEHGIRIVHKIPPMRCDSGKGAWFDLDVFLYYLIHNLKIDMQEVKERARLLGML